MDMARLPRSDCLLTVTLKYRNLVFNIYSRPEVLKANSVEIERTVINQHNPIRASGFV